MDVPEDYDDFGEGSKKVLSCFCASACPKGESEGTCLTKPGGKCFTTAEKIVENGKEELIIRYGCLPPNEMAFLQCKLSKVHNNTGRAVDCCNTHDFCNKFLLPSAPRADSPKPSNVDVNVLIISSVLSVITFAAVIAFLIKKITKNNNASSVERSIANRETTKVEKSMVAFNPEATLRERTIIDDIQLEIRLSEGKFTEIWRGSWRGDSVAIKIYNKKAGKEWRNEVDIFQTPLLKHHNLLGYIASSISDEDHMHIITDYHSAGSLRSFLRDNIVSQLEAVEMIKGLASALNYLHLEIRGSYIKPCIAHNNINSTSILVMKNKQCCVCDFSKATKISASHKIASIEGTFNGDIRYLAPEYLDKNLDPLTNEYFLKADIYSFSLILWEIMNRCEAPPEIINTIYKIPYDDELDEENLELSLDSLREIVVSRNIKPHVSIEWDKHEVLKELKKVMEECWNRDKSIRPTSLRIKKSILKIQEKVLVVEEEIVNEYEETNRQ